MHELFAPAFNFILAAALLYFVVKKPLLSILASRREDLKKALNEAARLELEAKQQVEEYSRRIQEFERESQNLLKKAEVDAELARQQVLDEARLTASKLIEDAERVVAIAIEEAKSEIRKEVIQKSIALAESTIRKTIASSDHSRINQEYIRKL